MNPISVGLIGTGMAARVFHIPVICSVPGLRLKTVVDRHGAESQKHFPHGVAVVGDAAALLQNDSIELVVIATPNSSHFDLARQCILSGKHVVVDKPFTTTSGQALQLIDLAHRHNRIISVFQNRRWDGDFITVRKIVEEKRLGRLVEFESHFDRFRNHPRPGAWKEEAGEGSGILFDLGPHLIDQSQVLFGLPKMITAVIRMQRDFAKTDDNFELILHYDNLKVTLKAGMLVQGPNPRFILHGSEGSFVKDGLDPQEEALKSGATPLEPNWGEDAKEFWGKLYKQRDGCNEEEQVETAPGCYTAFYQNMVEAIYGREELAVKPEQAMNTIRIIELANMSNEQKRTIPFSL